MKKIKIGNNLVGKNQPCFVIAEAGVNHNGSLEKAKLLVDIARKAGADAVKFQTWKTENLILQNVPSASYQKAQTGESDQYKMAKKLELSYSQFEELKGYCDAKGIMFLSTPADEESAIFLKDLVPAYKIGSGELNNYLFLRRIARFGKPMIVSTGMSTLEEVIAAKKAIYNEGNKSLIVLHCTTNYPTSLKEVNIRAMQTMARRLGILVGYSDHTANLDVPVLAVYLGACIIEKHFTYDKNAHGPDHKASLNSEELSEMIKRIRHFEKLEPEEKVLYTKKIRNQELILGDGIKRPTLNELENAKVVRKSLVAKKDIKKRAAIIEDFLDAKRTGSIGIPVNEYTKILGKKARQSIKSNEIITYGMVE